MKILLSPGPIIPLGPLGPIGPPGPIMGPFIPIGIGPFIEVIGPPGPFDIIGPLGPIGPPGPIPIGPMFLSMPGFANL